MVELARNRFRRRAPVARSWVAGGVLAIAIASLVACGAPAQPLPTSGSGTPHTGTPSATGSESSGASPSPGTTGSTTGSGIVVAGTVVSSPGCPGPAVAESPCPDRPVTGARVELTHGGTVVASTRTDGAGRFEMRVPPGVYQVTAFNVGFKSQASQQISVAGRVNVRLVVDSGLR